MFSFKVLVEIWPFQKSTAVAVIHVNHNFSLFNVFFQSTCGDMAISAIYCCCSYTCKSLILSLQCFLSNNLWGYGHFSNLLLVQVILVNYYFSIFNVFFQCSCGDMAISANYCCCSYTCGSLFLSLKCFLSKYLWRFGHFSKLLLSQLNL